jgi:5-methylthioadenosine/S-adenosylhomocysteine deaminase
MLIRNGQIMRGTGRILERADILIEGNQIRTIARSLPESSDGNEIDARDCIVIPGLINGHTHSHGNLAKGLVNNATLEDLWTYSAALWGIRTPEEHYVSAAVGAIDMLKTGCTAAYDMVTVLPVPTHDAMDAVVQAYVDAGLRVVVAPQLADIAFFRAIPGLMDVLPPRLAQVIERIEIAPTKQLLDLKRCFVERWDGAAAGRVRAGIAPVIPGQCTDEFFAGCHALADEHGLTLQTHLAETKIQVVAALRRWGKTPTGRLADSGYLGPRFVGGHCVWLTDEDIGELANAGAVGVHLPASNLKLGSGIAPVREMLDHGMELGLGCDGSISSDNQNMFESMRFASLIGNVRFPYEAERWVGAQSCWRMATSGSARALGGDSEFGILAPGYKADLVILDATSVAMSPLNDAINAFVHVETGASVRTVIVDGRIVVDGTRIVGLNEERICERAREVAERLRTANAPARALADKLHPHVMSACRTAAASPLLVNRYATGGTTPEAAGATS